MADVIDTAQERADLILSVQIQAARATVAGISAMLCIDCDRPIAVCLFTGCALSNLTTTPPRTGT